MLLREIGGIKDRQRSPNTHIFAVHRKENLSNGIKQG